MTTITQTITTLPAAPDPATDSPSGFATKAAASVLAQKAMVTELQTWTGQVNAVKGEMVTLAADTVAAAALAVPAANTATTKAAEAAASAASAAALAGAFVGTSTTSWTPTVGSQVFTTQSGEQYTPGVWVTVVSASDGTVNGYGQVTAYSGTSLTVNVQVVSGAVAKTDWNISIAGVRGPAGTGITPQTVGFTASGGTTSKTLTVDVDITASAIATKAGTELLTNKTLSATTNDVEARSLKSATTTVVVSGAAAPTARQVLTATSETTAEWQFAAGGTGTGAIADVKASRSLATTYTNSGATTRWVVVSAQATAAGLLDLVATVAGSEKSRQNTTATGAISHVVSITAPVPSGSTYSVSCGNGSVRNWFEFQ